MVVYPSYPDPEPQVFVTGFGPFPGVDVNPSGAIALALAEHPPAGIDVVAEVLPVSFARAPSAFEAALFAAAAPDAFLSMGVHPGQGFRLEQRARVDLGKPATDRPDVDGLAASGIILDGTRDRACSVDLDALAAVMRGWLEVSVGVSEDAGGYVCEAIYHHVLGRAAERQVPGVFLHVPPIEYMPVEEQVPVVAALLEALLARG